MVKAILVVKLFPAKKQKLYKQPETIQA